MLFRDREQAGRLLGLRLKEAGEGGSPAGKGPLVLGVPRGGVVVAAQVCEQLEAPMELVIPRKIGAPHNPEVAIAAVAPDGVMVLDEDLCRRLEVGETYLREERAAQQKEIARRLKSYRGDRPLPDFVGRRIILVDDGVATGLTIAAALRWLAGAGPARLTLAVPVAPPEAVERLKAECDAVVCLETPEPFWAVGQFYERFEQTSDREVVDLYRRHADRAPEPPDGRDQPDTRPD